MALQEDVLDKVNVPLNRLQLEPDAIIDKSNEILSGLGLSGDTMIYTRTAILFFGFCLVSFLLWWTSRKIFIQIIHTFAAKTKTKWDDYLVENKVFSAVAHLVPLIFMDYFIKSVFYSFPGISEFGIRLTGFVIVFVLLIVVLRFLNTARDVLSEKPKLKDKPIHSFFQLGRIVISIMFSILMISVVFNIDTLVILTSMGAMTAVILLVFKDTILGFVGSIQLASNDMIRIGDWVTMEKYGADGDVLEITLATVKVQNFDKTITTIPTYSFISDSFKNWRGMEESGGRRITRAINIQIDSIEFCTAEMLERYGEIELIRSYIDQKEKEIESYNNANDINKSVLLNGRNLTNIGLFRHYITEYLEQNENINENMTLMVRQLAPTEIGVALQVYAFTKTKDWPVYEAVTGDIFDHLMAAAKFFDLAIFEVPSGQDFQNLSK
jgi:miniconductance mechanosensitive channel